MQAFLTIEKQKLGLNMLLLYLVNIYDHNIEIVAYLKAMLHSTVC